MANPAKRTVGVIGGSGIYDLVGLTEIEEVAVETPFGAPSDRFITGRIGDVGVVFLARHGRGHRILPHEINYRANLFGLKSLGVEWLFSLSAVGSLREDIHPGDVVCVDQFIDRTQGRASTFFGHGIAAHVAFGDPVSRPLWALLADAATAVVKEQQSRTTVHRGGTYLVINGPQFSTRAESKVYRQWGADVIGMTNMPEAKLAREAEISYASLALVTDYDCWHESEEAVSVDAVVAALRANASLACAVLARAVAMIPEERSCPAARALDDAIMTDPAVIPATVKQSLSPIIGRALGC
ncbi:MAG TPA: S-methyl-5'-thioadenosine phosphorylase [Kofleriaceae bacterium]|nr:S-methyl-5'-thioadenosine phosphorylase [Kofleriaceae bacterium]